MTLFLFRTNLKRQYWMNYNNQITQFLFKTILAFSFIYICNRFFVILMVTINKPIFYNYLTNIDIAQKRMYGLIILTLIELLFLLFLYFFIIKKIRNDIGFYVLFIITVSPLLFDVSNIFYDKTCYKAWRHFDELIWFFPIRLPLWAFIGYFIKTYYEKLKKSDYYIIAICLILFNLIKPY